MWDVTPPPRLALVTPTIPLLLLLLLLLLLPLRVCVRVCNGIHRLDTHTHSAVWGDRSMRMNTSNPVGPATGHLQCIQTCVLHHCTLYTPQFIHRTVCTRALYSLYIVQCTIQYTLYIRYMFMFNIRRTYIIRQGFINCDLISLIPYYRYYSGILKYILTELLFSDD